ncbi:MAG TPA: restriction endonuclease [Anaerolineales bacterium]|nr:restriction endonuclease [Anaerolineales bacterium]
MALGFLKIVSEENRALALIGSSLGILGCLAAMLFIGAFRRRLRKWTWERAMSSWRRNSRAKITPKFALPQQLVEDELSQLAIRAFSRMGYRQANRKDTEAYLHLISPDGMIELVVCSQQPDPVALHHVYSLHLEMKRTKAVRGYFWAPAGFTDDCREWTVNRSIVLADQLEIGRLIDCAESKGSRLLEN